MTIFVGGLHDVWDMNFGRGCMGTPLTGGYVGGLISLFDLMQEIFLHCSVVHGYLAISVDSELRRCLHNDESCQVCWNL